MVTPASVPAAKAVCTPASDDSSTARPSTVLTCFITEIIRYSSLRVTPGTKRPTPRTPAVRDAASPRCSKGTALLFENGAEAREGHGSRLEWVAHHPANVGVLTRLRLALLAVCTGHFQRFGLAVVEAIVDRESHVGARADGGPGDVVHVLRHGIVDDDALRGLVADVGGTHRVDDLV